MPNMSPKKNPMPSQAPDVRNKNFLEVATGYTKEVAIDEAQRCLQCKNKPCVGGCPVNIAIPDFIKQVAEGNFSAAYDIINESSSLPAVYLIVTVSSLFCPLYLTFFLSVLPFSAVAPIILATSSIAIEGYSLTRRIGTL